MEVNEPCAAICVQTALENVGCCHYVLRVLSCLVDSLKDEKEKWDIIISYMLNDSICPTLTIIRYGCEISRTKKIKITFHLIAIDFVGYEV